MDQRHKQSHIEAGDDGDYLETYQQWASFYIKMFTYVELHKLYTLEYIPKHIFLPAVIRLF